MEVTKSPKKIKRKSIGENCFAQSSRNKKLNVEDEQCKRQKLYSMQEWFQVWIWRESHTNNWRKPSSYWHLPYRNCQWKVFSFFTTSKLNTWKTNIKKNFFDYKNHLRIFVIPHKTTCCMRAPAFESHRFVWFSSKMKKKIHQLVFHLVVHNFQTKQSNSIFIPFKLKRINQQTSCSQGWPKKDWYLTLEKKSRNHPKIRTNLSSLIDKRNISFCYHSIP